MRRLGLEDGIPEAARIIKNGGVVVYPTDTVYGIGCDVFNQEAVKRVYEAKQREAKPMPVLCSSLDDVLRVCSISGEALRIAHMVWPGPVSIIAPKRPELPDLVTSGMDEVAVRIPASLPVLEVMRIAETPIVGTSANISGRPPPRGADEVSPELLSRVDLLLDGGRSRYGEPSTVIKIEGGRLLVLREGALRRGELAELLRGAGIELSVE